MREYTALMKWLRSGWLFVDVEVNERHYNALDLETNNILSAMEIAFKRGMNEAIVKGAIELSGFLEARGLYQLADNYLNRSVQAARFLGDTRRV